ncbi:phage protease [Paradesulfitobacterium aromaticivorans]
MDKWFEIFKAGTYEPQGDFSEQDLDHIAQNYDPAKYEAPLVVGHPKTEDPAFGWVETVKRSGDKLLAKFKQVEPTFAEMVNQGRFKRVSVRLRKTDTGWALRHVGFLGAAAPAVEGLKPIQFSEEDGFDLQCDFAAAGYQPKKTKEDQVMPMTEEEKRALMEQLKADARKEMQAEFSTEKSKLETELAETKRKLALGQFNAFIETNKAKLPPAVRDGMAEFMAGLGEEVTVEFAAKEGDKTNTVKTSPLEFFKTFVAKMPDQVEFKEVAGKGQEDTRTVKDKDFGARVDEERLALHKKALDFAEKHKVPYEEALIQVSE